MITKENTNTKYVEIILTNITGLRQSVKKSFVLPGHAQVSNGDTVTFSTLETGAKIIFPNPELFETDELEIESGGSKNLTVSEQANGVYSYAVITFENNDLASGGSFPRFIVK